MPRVSVIIPTYNRKDYVQEAIDSVLAQTYTDYEIIVVDDGSTDGTGEALQVRYGDRIRYVWQENQGESVARNRATEMAQGEFIAFLDSDDLWMPEKLQRQVAYLEMWSDAGMVFGQAWLIDEHGERYGHEPLGAAQQTPTVLAHDSLLLRNRVSGPSTVLLRRELWQRIDGFDPQIRYGEDWDLWLQVARIKPIHAMSMPLACIRRHRGTQCYYPESSEKVARVLQDHLRLLEKAFGSLPVSSVSSLRSQAIANQYLEAFIPECHVGAAEVARNYLLAAQSHAPELLADSDWFGKLILNQVVQILENEPPSNFDSGTQYVEKVLTHLEGIGAYNQSFAKRITAEANAVIGLWVNQHWGRRKARPYLVNAVRQDIRWLGNTGLVLTVVKSFIPGSN